MSARENAEAIAAVARTIAEAARMAGGDRAVTQAVLSAARAELTRLAPRAASFHAGLTLRQAAVLKAIVAHQVATGATPSYEAIARTIGGATKSNVARHVDNLVARGALRRTKRRCGLLADPAHPLVATLLRPRVVRAAGQGEARP